MPSSPKRSSGSGGVNPATGGSWSPSPPRESKPSPSIIESATFGVVKPVEETPPPTLTRGQEFRQRVEDYAKNNLDLGLTSFEQYYQTTHPESYNPPKPSGGGGGLWSQIKSTAFDTAWDISEAGRLVGKEGGLPGMAAGTQRVPDAERPEFRSPLKSTLESAIGQAELPGDVARVGGWAVRNPAQAVAAAGTGAAYVARHPEEVGRAALEGLKQAAVDPMTYIPAAVTFGTSLAAGAGRNVVENVGENVVRNVAEETAESVAKNVAEEGAESVAKSVGQRQGQFWSQVDRIPTVRESLGMKPLSRVRAARGALVERAMPGPQQTVPRAVAKDILAGSPLKPTEGAGLAGRTAWWRSKRVGAAATTAGRAQTAANVGRIAYNPTKFAQDLVAKGMERAAAGGGIAGTGISAGDLALGAAGATAVAAPAVAAVGGLGAASKLFGGGDDNEAATTAAEGPEDIEHVMDIGEFTDIGPRQDYTPGRGFSYTAYSGIPLRQPQAVSSTSTLPQPPSGKARSGTRFANRKLGPGRQMTGISAQTTLGDLSKQLAGRRTGPGFWANQQGTFGVGESNRWQIAPNRIDRGPTTTAAGRAAGRYTRGKWNERQGRKAATEEAAMTEVALGTGPKGLPASSTAKYGNLTAAGRKPYASIFKPLSQPTAPSKPVQAQSVISTDTGTGPYANRGVNAGPRQLSFDLEMPEVAETKKGQGYWDFGI